MLKRFGLSALFAFMLLCLPLPAQAAEVGLRHTIKHGGVEREYYLYTPKTGSGTARPLVVVLHGGGGNPHQVARSTGFSEVAKREGFIVAYPAGIGHVPTWNAGTCCGYAERTQVDDVGFLDKMVKDIEKKQNIDVTRIYATGMSNGGMMAYRLGCELSGTFAAIAPVAGAFNVKQCEATGRPSLIIFHALDDKHVRYEGGMSTEGLRARIGRNLAPDTSIADSMKFWLEEDYCRDFPAHEDGVGYKKITYFCAEDRHVVLYTLDQGGHSWPRDSIDATDEIWRFFRQHPPRELF